MDTFVPQNTTNVSPTPRTDVTTEELMSVMAHYHQDKDSELVKRAQRWVLDTYLARGAIVSVSTIEKASYQGLVMQNVYDFFIDAGAGGSVVYYRYCPSDLRLNVAREVGRVACKDRRVLKALKKYSISHVNSEHDTMINIVSCAVLVGALEESKTREEFKNLFKSTLHAYSFGSDESASKAFTKSISYSILHVSGESSSIHFMSDLYPFVRKAFTCLEEANEGFSVYDVLSKMTNYYDGDEMSERVIELLYFPITH